MPEHLNMLSIGAFARVCGVSTPTVRYYEKIALLPKAERTGADQRRYGPQDVKRLNFIRRCRAFGFTTKQVRSLLAVPNGSAADCKSSRDIAQSRISDIRTSIADLLALEKDLNALIETCEETCGDEDGRVCGAFEHMQSASG